MDNDYFKDFLIPTDEPLPCASITVLPDADSGMIFVSWAPSPDEGVTYRLERNPGRSEIISEFQGEIMLDKTGKLTYTDEYVTPGNVYTYTVYAEKNGVLSEPVSKTVLFPVGGESRVPASDEAARRREPEEKSGDIPTPPSDAEDSGNNQTIEVPEDEDTESLLNIPEEDENEQTLSPLRIKDIATEEKTYEGAQGTDITSIQLTIRMEDDIPDNVARFCYAVRTSKAKSKWATAEDVRNGEGVHAVSRTDYLKHGKIFYQNYIKDEEELYITVFTVRLQNGEEVISEPEHKTVKRERNITIYWEVRYLPFGKLVLSYEAKSNIPFSEIPALTLCMGNEEEFVDSITDKDAETVMEIPPYKHGFATTEFKKSYELKTQYILLHYRRCKFYLFTTNPSDKKTVNLRWKTDYHGKL